MEQKKKATYPITGEIPLELFTNLSATRHNGG